MKILNNYSSGTSQFSSGLAGNGNSVNSKKSHSIVWNKLTFYRLWPHLKTLILSYKVLAYLVSKAPPFGYDLQKDAYC
jgi:hypothetical protein